MRRHYHGNFGHSGDLFGNPGEHSFPRNFPEVHLAIQDGIQPKGALILIGREHSAESLLHGTRIHITRIPLQIFQVLRHIDHTMVSGEEQRVLPRSH